jgi:hypothetical protein
MPYLSGSLMFPKSRATAVQLARAASVEIVVDPVKVFWGEAEGRGGGHPAIRPAVDE